MRNVETITRIVRYVFTNAVRLIEHFGLLLDGDEIAVVSAGFTIRHNYHMRANRGRFRNRVDVIYLIRQFGIELLDRDIRRIVLVNLQCEGDVLTIAVTQIYHSAILLAFTRSRQSRIVCRRDGEAITGVAGFILAYLIRLVGLYATSGNGRLIEIIRACTCLDQHFRLFTHSSTRCNDRLILRDVRQVNDTNRER